MAFTTDHTLPSFGSTMAKMTALNQQQESAGPVQLPSRQAKGVKFPSTDDPHIYLYMLIAIELLALAGFRGKFRAYHGG